MSHPSAGQGATRNPWGARLATAGAAAAVALTLVAPASQADTLSTLRERVSATRDHQQNAQAEIAESHQQVNSATSRLLESQANLDAARAALADIGVQLSSARENDALLAVSLQAARVELEAAAQRVARAEDEVQAQLLLIGQAARDTFQQHSDLRELSVVFGSESTADLGQRLQWSRTVLDTQAAEKSRLDGVLAELEAARRAQAEIEARIAADKAASERAVARISWLEAQAEAQAATVASLVSSNQKARAEAQSELDADEAAFRTLQAEENRLQGEIEAEIARIRAVEEAERKRAAEEAARVQAALEAEGQRAAAEARRLRAAAAAAARRASTEDASTEGTASGSRSSSALDGPAVSAQGFVRPISATPGSRFGLRFHPILKYWRNHNGVDYGAKTGTPLYAAKAGTVMSAGPNGGFGNFVLIGHGDIGGRYATTGYAHLSRIVVGRGQKVSQGQLIGYVGSTGLSTTPHLHLEVRLDGAPVNPLVYIP